MNPSLLMNPSIYTCELLHSKFQTNGKLKKSVIGPYCIWDKELFKNGPSKICGRQPLKKLK